MMPSLLEQLGQQLPLMPPRHVVFVVLPGVELLDLAGPAQVFAAAAEFGTPYTLHFCGLTDALVSGQGLHLARLSQLPEVGRADLILIPGVRVTLETAPTFAISPVLRNWLAAAHAQRIPIASVCTAAFVLGEAGLLDGRRCTTHWLAVAELQRRYPTARVEDSV